MQKFRTVGISAEIPMQVRIVTN